MNKSQTGTLLLAIGVAAWLVYMPLKYAFHVEVPVAPFLAWHLLGVIPGSLLRGSRLLRLIRRGWQI
ncbi:MAG: hypothetical protein HY535_00620 [Chloroflexi bacterium]|nr:hypothetical protein [Chloroflexota bacterium]